MEIGVDIGGTFTDIVALADDGRLHLTKVPTTPKDLLSGVADAVRGVLALAGAEAGGVRRFIHGTTVATNAILEQTGAVTGVFMTAGFEDVLELGRQKRSRMYDLDMDAETPAFLAPRRRRVGIRERLDARGRVLVPLDEAQVRAEAARLRDEGVQALAVCYLFSFLDPAHERRTRELIREVAPGVAISLSSEVDPTFREYERLCVLDRAISVEAARAQYGVVLSPDGTAVDHDATKECREAMRRARGPIHWVFDRGGEHGREG